jgi:hypothetical protein
MKPLRSLILVCAFLVFVPVLAVAEQGVQTGTVAETMTAGGYVYIKLEEQGIWLAANSFAVSAGDKVQYSGGMEMNEFHSKALDRTFDSIWFVQQAGLVSKDDGAKPAGAAADHGGSGMGGLKPMSALAPAAGEITPLKDGKTVAAIFAESEQLKGQTVSLNAKVIKVNENIMGKNWITLQDGTGTEPDHKLLVTSQEVVAPGAVVIATGVVKTDVDLGYGYEYKVLMEEASFTSGSE